MRKILSTLALTSLAILPLQADLQMTLMDKDGVQIKQCIKSYSFSNNLESLAKQKGIAQDVYSEEETLTNKVYLGKPVYRKIVTIDFDASNASHTNPLNIVIPYEGVDTLFIKDGFITQLDNGKKYIYNGHRLNLEANTYYYFRTINNKIELRIMDKRFINAKAIIEYTKTSDVSNITPNTFKSYIHYIPSSSTVNELVSKDLENRGVIFDKNYVYDSSTDSCTPVAK